MDSADLWLVVDDGSIVRLASDGTAFSMPLPGERRARVVRSGGSARIWVSALEADGASSLWTRSDPDEGWTFARDLPVAGAIAGAADGGVWTVGSGRLELIGPDGGERSAVATGFQPRDVSEGADGTLWALGGRARLGGYPVSRYEPASGSWFELPVPAAAVRIAGAPDGTVWSVSSKGAIWRLHPQGAGQFRECGMVADCTNCLYSPSLQAREVSVSADGHLWFLSDEPAAGGHAVYRMTDFTSRRTARAAPAWGAVSLAVAAGRRAPVAPEAATPAGTGARS